MVKTALISVFDKTNVVELAQYLVRNDYNIISTGGTARHLKENNVPITEISDYTNFPEILNGRVKTLNPLIYGGILNVRNDVNHQDELNKLNIQNIDLVAVNLYPFEKVIENEADNIEKCIENIDIGGVSLLRASAKNFNDVYILSNPAQYHDFINNNSNVDKRQLALDAFRVTSNYDAIIGNWFSRNNNNQINNQINNEVSRRYEIYQNLKYGCNPYQTNAGILSLQNEELPFSVVHGNVGYINVLDALNAWFLVSEIRMSLNIEAATSFKHTSPAGVAIYTPLSNFEQQSYTDFYGADKINNLSNIGVAYLRARNSDPKSSFGDFIGVNTNVDITLANIIKGCVADGIIAPSYDEEALDVLKQKKKGNFIILQGNSRLLENYENNDTVEYREFKNCVLSQAGNNKIVRLSDLNTIVTQNTDVSNDIRNDMIMSLIALKYTQSNSVGYAYRGQMIGIGAGQQSRIDCVRLARMKAETWFLRRHPKCLSLNFRNDVKKQDRINGIIQYIEDDFTNVEYNRWKELFTEVPQPLTLDEKRDYLDGVSEVLLSSDAFFPFRDSIDKASKIGVKYIVQPGGSIADEKVVEACNEYGMAMINTNMRLFHH